MNMSVTTLCYLEKDDCYLMMHRVKKKNDENKDKWIGVGGHTEKYESPEDCLLREVREETGLILTKYRFRGIITFSLLEEETQYMCLYTATEWEGEMVSDCSEGNLEWVPKSRINELSLWTGDKVFFKLLEQDHPFFSLKLTYEKDRLIDCVLDGQKLDFQKFIAMDKHETCEFQITKAAMEDVEEMYLLEQKAYQQMPIKEWYVPDDRTFFENHIEKEGFVLKAVSPQGRIAGFLVVRYPKDAPDNLFFDVQKICQLPEEEYALCAHMESVAVDSDFRGYHLQEQLIREGTRIAASEGYLHFCATVHPDNT